MTDRRDDPPTPAPDDADTGASTDAHLVCAYSPAWLSGPVRYEGLVATVDVHDHPTS
jgi:hypothetical protein